MHGCFLSLSLPRAEAEVSHLEHVICHYAISPPLPSPALFCPLLPSPLLPRQTHRETATAPVIMASSVPVGAIVAGCAIGAIFLGVIVMIVCLICRRQKSTSNGGGPTAITLQPSAAVVPVAGAAPSHAYGNDFSNNPLYGGYYSGGANTDNSNGAIPGWNYYNYAGAGAANINTYQPQQQQMPPFPQQYGSPMPQQPASPVYFTAGTPPLPPPPPQSMSDPNIAIQPLGGVDPYRMRGRQQAEGNHWGFNGAKER